MTQATLATRFAFVFGGLNGFFSIGLGAWLAHAELTQAIKESLSIAIHYQLIHAVVLVALAFGSLRAISQRILNAAVLFFSIGIVLFSWLIIAKYLIGFSALSALTPWGGISFMLAWCLVVALGVTFRKVN